MLGHPISFPLALVKAEIRGAALRAMYPGDYPSDGGWVHRVAFPTENLMMLAEAFTGSGGKYAAIARRNGLRDPDLLRIGTEILIPLEWLSEDLELRPVSLKPPLVLERDPRTRRQYALYTIRKDETLYSSVILRFTDREFAEEVNRMAQELVRLNGLRDAEHVPAGQLLRIPLEWISEEFLHAMPGWRAEVPEPLRPPRRPPSKSEASPGSLHVIIDPGHGGVDPGAIYGRRPRGDLTYEDEIVYDIGLRLGRRLERQGHKVHYTLRDSDQPNPLNVTDFPHDTDEWIPVTPPYHIDHVDVGVNMRVYLIESLYRQLVDRQGVAPEQILLISIHGDALAPMLRGAMVYYPDAGLRHHEYRPLGRVYRLRKEALPASIRFAPRENEAAARLSKDFAEAAVRGLKAQGLGVGGRRPVRSFYYRDDRRTLPAVLRYSRVPSAVLVEVANLNNPLDRRQIRQPDTRQRIALGLAAAVEEMARGQMALAAKPSLP
jgi:N-acetylmuramoyl-L-alanine amidase